MNASADLLIELGTEELPPKTLKKLSDAFSAGILKGLGEAGLEFTVSKSFATPRRLSLLVRDLPLAQADREVERRGPAVSAAFDADGNARPAAMGFAKSCGVEINDLQRISTDKGEYLMHKALEAGQPTADLLSDILDECIKRLPIAKRMRWGDLDVAFVRPVQWLVVMLGNEVVPVNTLGVKAGSSTRGHRFHAPDLIKITSGETYAQQLEEAYVLADFDQRRARIRDLVLAAAQESGGTAILDEDLLDEVTSLLEWPVPVTGKFDERFLELPKEVLVTALQEHQRYFCIEDQNGQLLPAFITLSNLQSQNPAKVQSGNERVVRPRLEDAMFFWAQDRKKTLDDFASGLANVTFVNELGSMGDKGQRVALLAASLVGATGADCEKVARAAQLAKADLLTDMVFEFTELQGVMGRYYALAAGEDAEVAQAIDEQYQPRFAGDVIPSSGTGRTLALADKLDSLAGIFAIGKRPTGDRDPYALRRATLGVLRILIESNIRLDLSAVLKQALDVQPAEFDKQAVQADLMSFVLDRARGYFAEQGVTAEVFESVRAIGVTDPLDMQARIQAVQAFLQRPEAEALAAAHKRVRNILKEAEAGNCDPALFTNAAETGLYETTQSLLSESGALIESGLYEEALAGMAILREPVDAFFEGVMVMDEDMAIRNNRLALLAALDRLCRSVVDISCLPG